jgi:type IV secretion system protein VirD4
MAATIHWRRDLGEVRVFDPTASTNQPGAGWSPLRGARTVTGAQKAARALVDGGPRGSSESLEFFMRLAEQLLWPHLYLAAAGELTIADVVRWILIQDHPDPDRGYSGEVWPLLHAEHDHPDLTRKRAALDVEAALDAIWALDERTRSSTYATAQTLLTAWADPTIAASGDRQEIDLDWLLGGANTLYVCAPLHEQARLAPVLSGLLGDLLNQAYERVSRADTPLVPTLVVMDEAGNTPARWLPQIASTCAGIGLLLVTIWQSKAQIDAAYGALADSVLANHGTKILFSGISDPSTLDYAAGLLGDEDVLRRQVSMDLNDGGRRSVSESAQPVRLVPAHMLRQVRPGEALLIHGTLPPAHLHSRPYFRDRRLRARARAGPRGPE